MIEQIVGVWTTHAFRRGTLNAGDIAEDKKWLCIFRAIHQFNIGAYLNHTLLRFGGLYSMVGRWADRSLRFERTW